MDVSNLEEFTVWVDPALKDSDLSAQSKASFDPRTDRVALGDVTEAYFHSYYLKVMILEIACYQGVTEVII